MLFSMEWPDGIDILVVLRRLDDAHSAALKAIKAAYDPHDIVIPFPIRTVDFGIKGGKSYQDVLTAIGD